MSRPDPTYCEEPEHTGGRQVAYGDEGGHSPAVILSTSELETVVAWRQNYDLFTRVGWKNLRSEARMAFWDSRKHLLRDTLGRFRCLVLGHGELKLGGQYCDRCNRWVVHGKA